MPNPLTNPIIKELVMEKLNQIKNADEAYILANNNPEKIKEIELKNSMNFARIIITTTDEKVYYLTPSEFLRKVIKVKKGDKEITMRG